MNSSKISLREGFDFLFEQDEVKKSKVKKFNIQYSDKDINTDDVGSQIAFILSLDIASAAINKASDTILTKNFYSGSNQDDKDSFFVGKTLNFQKLDVATKNAGSFAQVFGITEENQNKSITTLFTKYRECIEALTNSSVSGIMLTEADSQPVKISLQRYKKMIMVLKNTAALPKDNRGNKINFNLLFEKIMEYIDGGQLFKEFGDIDQKFKELSNHEKLLYGFQQYLKTLSRYQKQNIRMNVIKTFMSDLSDGEKDIKDIYNDFVSSMGARTSGKMKRAIKELTVGLIEADSTEEVKAAISDAASASKEEASDKSGKKEEPSLQIVMGNAPTTFESVFPKSQDGLNSAVSMLLAGETLATMADPENTNLLINQRPKTLISLSKISINLRDIIDKKYKIPAQSDLNNFINAVQSAAQALSSQTTKLSLLEELGFNYKLEVSHSAAEALLKGIISSDIEGGEFNVEKVYNVILAAASKLKLSFGNYQESEDFDLPPEGDINRLISAEEYQAAAEESPDFESLIDAIKSFSDSAGKIDQEVLTPDQVEDEFNDIVDELKTQVMSDEELEQYKQEIKADPIKGVESLLDQALSNTDDGSQSSEETDPDEDEDDPSLGFFDKIFLKSENKQIEAKKGEFVKVIFDTPVSVKVLMNTQGEKETVNVTELTITHNKEKDNYYLECNLLFDRRNRKPNKTLSWENLIYNENIPDRLVNVLLDTFKGGDEESKTPINKFVTEIVLPSPKTHDEFMRHVIVYSTIAYIANDQFLRKFNKNKTVYSVEELVSLFEKEIFKIKSKVDNKTLQNIKDSFSNFKKYGDKKIDQLLIEEERQEKDSFQIKLSGSKSLESCVYKLNDYYDFLIEFNEKEQADLFMLLDTAAAKTDYNINLDYKIVRNGKATNTSIEQAVKQLHSSESVTHTVEDNTITLRGDDEELLQLDPITNTAYVHGALEQTDSTLVDVPALEDRPAAVIQAACNDQLDPEDLEDLLQEMKELRDDVSASVGDEEVAASGLTSSELSNIARQKDQDTADSDDSEEESDDRGELSLDDFKEILNNSFKKFYPDEDRIIDSFNKYNQKYGNVGVFENNEDFEVLRKRSLIYPQYEQAEIARMLPRPNIEAIRPFLKDAYQNEMQVIFDTLYDAGRMQFKTEEFLAAYTNLITNATYRAIGEDNSNDRVAEVLGEGLFDALKRSSSAGISWLPKLGKGMAIMSLAKIGITAMGGAALIGPIIGSLGLMGIFSAGKSAIKFQKEKKQYAKNPLKYIEETVFNDRFARNVITDLVENAIAKQICDIINGKVKKSKLDMNALSLKNVQNSIEGYVDYYSGLSDEDKENLKNENARILDAMKCTSLYQNEIINDSTINIIFNKLYLHEKGLISTNPNKAKNYSELFEEILKAIDKTSFKANFTNWTENEVRLVSDGKSKSSSRFQIEYRDEIKDKKQLFISPEQISTDYINYLFSKAFGVFLDDAKKESEMQETLQEGLYFNPDFAIKGSLTKLLFEDSKIMLNEQQEEESSSGNTNALSNYTKTMMCLAADASQAAQIDAASGGALEDVQFDILSAVRGALISEAGAEPVNFNSQENVLQTKIDKINIDNVSLQDAGGTDGFPDFIKKVIYKKLNLLTDNLKEDQETKNNIIEFLTKQHRSGGKEGILEKYFGYYVGYEQEGDYINAPTALKSEANLDKYLEQYIKFLSDHKLKFGATDGGGKSYFITKLKGDPDVFPLRKYSDNEAFKVNQNMIQKVFDEHISSFGKADDGPGDITSKLGEDFILPMKKIAQFEKINSPDMKNLIDLLAKQFVGESSIAAPVVAGIKAVSQASAEVDSNVKVSDSFSEEDLKELNNWNEELGFPKMKADGPLSDYAKGVSKAIANTKSDNIDQATAKKLASKLSDLSSDETVSKIKGAEPFFKSFSSALTSPSTPSAGTSGTLKVAGAKFGYVSSPAEAMQYQKMHFDPIIKEILIEEGGRQKILQFFMSSQESLLGKAKALGCVKIDLSRGTSEFMGSGPSFQQNYVNSSQNADYLERLGVVFKGGDGTGKLPELAEGGPAKELSPDDILSKKGLSIVLNSLKGSVKQVYEASETAVKKLALKSALQSDAEFTANALGEESNFKSLAKFSYKQWSQQGLVGKQVGQDMKVEGPQDVLKLIFNNANKRIEDIDGGPTAIKKFLSDPDISKIHKKIISVDRELDKIGMGSPDDIGAPPQDDSIIGKFLSKFTFDISMPGGDISDGEVSAPDIMTSASKAEIAEVDALMAKKAALYQQWENAIDKGYDKHIGNLGKTIMKVVVQSFEGDAKSQGYNPLYKSLVEDIANKTGRTAEEVAIEVKESDATGLSDPDNNISISSDKSGGSTETIEKFAAAKAEQVKAELISKSYDSEIDPIIKNIDYDDAISSTMDKISSQKINTEDPITNKLSSKFENIFDQELSKQLDLNSLDASKAKEAQQIITNAVKSPDTSSAVGAASKIKADAVQKAASKAVDDAAAKAAPKIEQTLKDNGVGQEEAKQAADAIVQKAAAKAKIDAIKDASSKVSEDNPEFNKMMKAIKDLQSDSKEAANEKVIQKVIDPLDGDKTSEVNNAMQKLSKAVQNVAQKAVSKEVGDSSITSGTAKSSLTDSILKTLSDPDGLVVDSTYTSYAAIGGILSKIASKFWTRGIKGGAFAKQFVAAAKPERMFAVVMAQAITEAGISEPDKFHNKYGNNRPELIQKAVDDFTKGVNPSLIKFKFDSQEDESIDVYTIEQASELQPAAEQVSDHFVYKTSISNFLFEGLVTKRYDINENLNLNSYRKEINDHNNLIKEFKNFFK